MYLKIMLYCTCPFHNVSYACRDMYVWVESNYNFTGTNKSFGQSGIMVRVGMFGVRGQFHANNGGCSPIFHVVDVAFS